MNWDSIPVERVSEGIRRQMVTGERLMMCRLQMAPHTVTPVHSHPHEQMTIIEQGRVRFDVDNNVEGISKADVQKKTNKYKRNDPARAPAPDTVTTTPSPHRSWNTVSPATRAGGSRRAGEGGSAGPAFGRSFSSVRTRCSGISRRKRDGGL